ncbi:unnamed protein product [Chrysoparadoxa australica]
MACSRELSRQVATAAQQAILDVPGVEESNLPSSCPLRLSSQLYADQEDNKANVRLGTWECKYCGKNFVSEKYIDRHMDNKHTDKLQHAEHVDLCLADLCDVFGCSLGADGEGASSDFVGLERVRYHCRSLLLRCFPPDETPELFHRFQHQFCDKISEDQFGRIVRPAPPGMAPQDSPVRTALTVIAVILLVVLYFVLWLINYDSSAGGEGGGSRAKRKKETAWGLRKARSKLD